MTDKIYSFGKTIIAVRSDADIPDSPKQRAFYATGKPDHIIHVTVAERLSEISGDNTRVFSCDEQRIGDYCAAAHGQDMTELCFTNAFTRCLHMNRVFECADIFGILLSYGAFVLHASYIIQCGGAILFTAPSGTGKSTQARLWEKYRGARIINEDRVLIDKTDSGFNACGIYFSGSGSFCDNISAPLYKIAVIEQAKEDSASPLPAGALLQRLMSQCSYDTSDPTQVSRLITLISQLTVEVPICRLRCTMTETAVRALEDYGIRRKPNE